MLMVELKKPVKSNLGLLQAQLFVQAGLDKSVVDKAKLIVEWALCSPVCLQIPNKIDFVT